MAEDSGAKHGELHFFSVDLKGALKPLSRLTGQRESWSMVVPGNFGGSSRTDLLFYDAPAGEAALCFVDHRGGLEPIRSYTGWRTTWSHLVPGTFSRDPWFGILFYDRETGDLEISRTDGLGHLLPLASYPGWRPGWDIIVPGRFTDTGGTDLLCYDRRDGRLEFYTTNLEGKVELVNAYGDQFWDWDTIVPISRSVAGLSDLLCYSRRERLGRVYSVRVGGKIRHVKSHQGWSRGWDLIAPLTVKGLDRQRLLFYDRSAGVGWLMDLDDEGEAHRVREYKDWKRTWCTIVPGHFTPDGITDLVFYDRFAEYEEADKARHSLGCRYEVLGSMDGPLGVPCLDLDRAGSGWVRRFLHGDIYWRSDINANEVHGPIRDRYLQHGGPDGPLGLPTSVPRTHETRNLTFQSFDGGVILLHPDGQTEVKRAVTFGLDRLRQRLEIRDGPALRRDDANAELILYVTADVNGKPVPGFEKRRVPPEGHMGSGNDLEVEFQVPLTSGLRLEILVRAYDVDPVGPEDYLGTWRIRYGYDQILSHCLRGGHKVTQAPIHEFEWKSDAFRGKNTLGLDYHLSWAD